jgi:biopolymer transport protein ExbB
MENENTLLQETMGAAVDNTAAAETVVEQQSLSVIELMTSGGIGGQLIMITLFILSMITVYLFFERFGVIKKASKMPANFMLNMRDFIYDKKYDAAKDLCRRTNNSVARMYEKGIDKLDRPKEDVALYMENVAKQELHKLENNLASLATVAGAAPMIGFLGTVIGMIIAFHEMASAGGQIDIEMLSKGIYTAMTTTVAGLIVGIVAYLAYNVLTAKVEKAVFQMESANSDFVELLDKH